MSSRAAILVLLVLTLAAAPAAAQGRGKGLGKGRVEVTTAVPSSSGPTAAIRQFGSWLDDASLLEPGQGWAALSFGHYRMLGGRQTDFPVFDAGYALTPRVQVGASVPLYRLYLADGTRVHGLGDVYLTAKVSIVDPAQSDSGIGFAVLPLVEVLSHPDPIDGGRLFWALPVSAEIRQEKYRVYGSGGYFSRGAVFGSGALEVPVHDRVIVTGGFIVTRALNDDPIADSLRLSKTRADVTGGAAAILTPAIAAFGSIGRTISGTDENGLSLMLSGGLSFTFTR